MLEAESVNGNVVNSLSTEQRLILTDLYIFKIGVKITVVIDVKSIRGGVGIEGILVKIRLAVIKLKVFIECQVAVDRT